MIAICGNDVVIISHQRHASDRDRLLSVIKMEKAAHFLLGVLTERFGLEVPDANHVREELYFLLRGEACVRRRLGEVRFGSVLGFCRGGHSDSVFKV